MKLKQKNIRVSLFIEPRISDIQIAKKLNVSAIELHTGKYCNIFKRNKNVKSEFYRILSSALYAKKIGLDVHAGHGLTYKTASKISKIKFITEFNIGHFIVSESIFFGLRKTILKFKKIINK